MKEIKIKFNLIRFCYSPFGGISSESVKWVRFKDVISVMVVKRTSYSIACKLVNKSQLSINCNGELPNKLFKCFYQS